MFTLKDKWGEPWVSLRGYRRELAPHPSTLCAFRKNNLPAFKFLTAPYRRDISPLGALSCASPFFSGLRKKLKNIQVREKYAQRKKMRAREYSPYSEASGLQKDRCPKQNSHAPNICRPPIYIFRPRGSPHLPMPKA